MVCPPSTDRLRASGAPHWAAARRPLALVALLLAACGGESTVPPRLAQQDAAKIQERIDTLQSQVDQLEGLSNSLRRDVDSIDAQRQAITAQIDNLRRDLVGTSAPVKATSTEKPATTSIAAPGRPKPVAEAAGKSSGYVSMAIKFVFVAAIIGAVIYLGTIFLGRWGPEESEMVERENELGTVRYPAHDDEERADEHGEAEGDDDDEERASERESGSITLHGPGHADDDYPPGPRRRGDDE